MGTLKNMVKEQQLTNRLLAVRDAMAKSGIAASAGIGGAAIVINAGKDAVAPTR